MSYTSRNLISVIFGILLVFRLGCSTQKMVRTEVKVDPERENHHWILGSWIRTNDEEGKVTYEIWEKYNDTTYTGLGFTMVEMDTVFKEKLTLIPEKRFEVRGVGDQGLVIFQMTSHDRNSFTLENRANEFPKKIIYKKTEAGMQAVISGSGSSISFNFIPHE